MACRAAGHASQLGEQAALSSRLVPTPVLSYLAGLPDMPPSWVNKLVIPRDCLDMRCPKGVKSTLYHRCQHEIFALFGECARWDGMVERITLYEVRQCLTPSMSALNMQGHALVLCRAVHAGLHGGNTTAKPMKWCSGYCESRYLQADQHLRLLSCSQILLHSKHLCGSRIHAFAACS